MMKTLYNAPITRKTPLLITFLLDMSGSMNEVIDYEGVSMTKSTALNTIVNRTIEEMICRCQSIDGVRNYFEFMAIGYGDDEPIQLFDEVIGSSTYGQNIYTVTELDKALKDSFVRQRRFVDKDGNVEYSQYKVKQYIKAHSSGKTPMYMALREAHDRNKQWINDHSGVSCFPPIIINITDGEATDATYQEINILTNKIKSLKTDNGNVLLLNIHMGKCQDSSQSVKFPVREEELPTMPYAKDLFNMSSVFPESMLPILRDILNDRDIDDLRGAKMMTFNTSIATILQALSIGTVSLTNYYC